MASTPGQSRRGLWWTAAAASVLAAAAAAFVVSGAYDVSATDQHLPPTFALLRYAMERSVERRAPALQPAHDAATLREGGDLYRRHCVRCHGAPGVAPEQFALGLRPQPTPLVRSGRERDAGFIAWVVRHGLKMTGMPAWEFRLSDAEIAAVTAFVKSMPAMSPRDFAALPPLAPPRASVAATTPPDRERGRRALDQYACITCHDIPGLTGTEAAVGPPLGGIGARSFIAGILPNTPANLARWIEDPPGVSPGTAMPNLGVAPRDARDMAAFLETLR